MDIGKSHVAALVEVGQLEVIETHQAQYRRVDIVNHQRILDRLEAKFIGRAIGAPALNAGTGEPGTEGIGVMVATVAAFC